MPAPPVRPRSGWFARQCPSCGSTNVRRSTLRSRESATHSFKSPYRCRKCNERFWIMSRKARGLTAASIVAGVFAVLAIVYVIVSPSDDDPSYDPTATIIEEPQVLKAPVRPLDTAPPARSTGASSPPAAPRGLADAPMPAAAPPVARVPATDAPKDAEPSPLAAPSPPAAPDRPPLRPPVQPYVK